jgi:mannose-6-phosphate isomerase-like protein (cupin superfamily)
MKEGEVNDMPQKKTRIAEAAELLTKPFTHIAVGQVDQYCAYLSRFAGTYKFHEHAKDELYVVWEGEIFIDYFDGPSVPVRRGETLVVKAGERHRSRAEKEALVLMFKAAHLFAE